MKKISLYIMVLFLIGACTSDPDLGPLITVDNAEIGAFPRTLNLVSGEYDLMDLQNSSYVHDLDFRSEDGGNNIAQYNIFVMYNDNDPSNGDNSSERIIFKEYTQSDFGTSDDGNKSITLNFPFTEVAAATGVDLDNVSPGDNFSFTSEVILSDGRTFAQGNTDSTINGPAFKAFFNWTVNATCPLPNDLFVGTYAISHTDGPNNPWATGVREANVELALVAGSTTVRDIVGLVVIDAFGGFDMGAQVEFVCSTATWLDSAPGVGCGAAPILYNSGGASPQDITDDSSITLIINEEGGDCGYSNTDVIVLTKQ